MMGRLTVRSNIAILLSQIFISALDRFIYSCRIYSICWVLL